MTRSRLVFDHLKHFLSSEIDTVIPLGKKMLQPIKSARLLQLVQNPSEDDIVLRANNLMNFHALILALPFGVAACSGLLNSNQPAEIVYWLDALVVQQAAVPDGALPGLAVIVSAAPGLDTDRLLILGPGARLNHYAAARWPDNNPEVLEALLRTTLESTGRYSRVTAGHTYRSADWELELEVRELYTLANASEDADTVRMVLNGYVGCSESDHAIALRADVGIEDNRLSQIVAGYQQALHEISRQLVAQLAEACKSIDLSAS